MSRTKVRKQHVWLTLREKRSIHKRLKHGTATIPQIIQEYQISRRTAYHLKKTLIRFRYKSPGRPRKITRFMKRWLKEYIEDHCWETFADIRYALL